MSIKVKHIHVISNPDTRGRQGRDWWTFVGRGRAVKNLVWKAGPGGQSVRLRATIGEDEESQKERDRVAE